MRAIDHYSVYVELKTDTNNFVTEIAEGFCVCPAGVQFNCQHVGATLWTVNGIVVEAGRWTNDDGVSCTSQLQKWGAGTGDLKTDLLLPIDDYVFRKLVPKKKKKRSGNHDSEVERKRSRTVSDIYKKAKRSCVGKHVDEDAILEWQKNLDIINRAYTSKKPHNIDISLYDKIDWDNLTETDYPLYK